MSLKMLTKDPSLENFTKYSRLEWKQLYNPDNEIIPINQLLELVSSTNHLTQKDLKSIYLPILQYIILNFKNNNKHLENEKNFLKTSTNDNSPSKIPLIIGISGSVAVGKSTIARILYEILRKTYTNEKIELMNTDSFLYPNRILKEKGIINKKGFLESYDMERLINFMNAVKINDRPIEYPIYSHEIYDIIPNKVNIMFQPDILIVEGVNVLQLPKEYTIHVSDFFDLTIYVDADHRKINQWYLERFGSLLEENKNNPESPYYFIAQLSREKARNLANKVWYTVNYINLKQHILPTRNRANLIIHKTNNHFIDEIYARK